MSNHIPLVLFSGGADSTAVLQYRLENGACDILIADSSVGELKLIAEERARTSIIEYLNRQDCTVGRILKTYDLRTSLKIPVSRHWPLQQMPVWFMAALTTLDPDRHSMVDVGYVLGDDAQGSLDKLETLWNMAVDLFLGPMWDSQKGRYVPLNIPLVFPFRYSDKKSIYKRLGSDLFHLTWSCECPICPSKDKQEQIEPCGDCKPCKTRRAVEVEMGWPFDKLATVPSSPSDLDITDPASPLRKETTPKTVRPKQPKRKRGTK